MEEKQQQEQQQQSADSSSSSSSSTQQQQQQQEPEVRKMKGQSLTQQQPIVKKKKKTKQQNNNIHISNENELVDAIIALINNVPNSAKITVSAVGDRLQEMTGHSWNKKWKKNYGPLKSFLEGRNEFLIDSKDHVSLKQHKQESVQAKTKVKKQQAPVVQNKQQKLKNRTHENSESPSRSSNKRSLSSESEGSWFRIIFVIALVIAVLLFTIISLDAGSIHFFEQIKKQFRS